ncbi:NRAMP family divalent metal transporter [Vibrio aquimaris]|uniref:Divalent metal cation transporter MntH n=1 Tax=Vibrio aquimaris TaxID=2587862 RepID=A0A5P9CLQ5_9VIBR|nr:NRAMP family divalent metal transporter [Vibrio aquimaris]QFT26667.1 Divalent metal cation transporter MntH [Vibrio aquimaris]
MSIDKVKQQPVNDSILKPSTKGGFNWSLILGAAFLMATSAVGPGFLTQTTVFTQTLGASFAFVILVSIFLDIGAQLNIWRVIVVSKKRAQDIANDLLPGLGFVIAGTVALGGLAFNIGNLGGAGMGMNVLFPNITPVAGAAISAVIAISLFLLKDASKEMDRFTIVMGASLMVMTLYVLLSTSPPVSEALYRSVWPEKLNVLAIVTLVGGTVGGYITFTGAHRLIDAGVTGQEALPQVNSGSISAISLASVVRVILFLAALGVISTGVTLDPENPTASMFQHAAGNIGYKLFGLVLWTAAITSVIGAAYTSVSFLKTLHPFIARNTRGFIIGFILASSLIFCFIGKPVTLLIVAGALNGFILPATLSIMLIAARKSAIVGDYKHPVWMSMFGWLITIMMAAMSLYTLFIMTFG